MSRETLNLVISGAALFVSLATFLFVVVQVRAYLRQLRFDSLSRILETNRELLVIGFEHPDLLSVLEGEPLQDSRRQKRYLQLWINQMNMMWIAQQNGMIDRTTWV